MTIHGSGTPIYASEIEAEFGYSGRPMWLSNYYAGGAFVPAGTVGEWGPIPSGGNITLGHFYGASKRVSPVITFGQSSFTPRMYGYDAGTLAGPFGALSPNTAWPFGGSPILTFGWQSSVNRVTLTVDGLWPNSGWTNVDMPGLGGYNRASATNYVQNLGATSWQWATGANAFGNTGGTSPVNFT